MNDGLPFPIADPALLSPEARRLRLSNMHITPKPGDLVCHCPNVTPARVHYWPDHSGTDQEIARAYAPGEWGFIVDPDTLFSVANVAYDNLGNFWCLVLVLVHGTDGRMGYVHNVCTIEDWEREAHRYRQNWVWVRKRPT